MKLSKEIYCLFLIACVSFPPYCIAQSTLKENGKNKPIEITSERMTATQKSNRIIFIGNVVAKRGDLTIFSDEMTVYNDKKKKKIEKIIAQGHVRIERKGKYATGGRATYYEEQGRIVLKGNPRAWEEDNEIVGTEMIFFLDEDKFIVKGSIEKKIKLTFYPEEDNKKKK